MRTFTITVNLTRGGDYALWHYYMQSSVHTDTRKVNRLLLEHRQMSAAACTYLEALMRAIDSCHEWRANDERRN